MQKYFHINRFILFFYLLLLSGVSFCQNNISKGDSTKSKTKVNASFGPYQNGSKAFAADIKKLLATNPELKVKDEKGNVCQVVSFEILWKKKDMSEDIRTGNQKTVYYFVGATIKAKQLPDNWKEEITNYIQKGEEISFNTIIYIDPQKKNNMRAPSLTINIL